MVQGLTEFASPLEGGVESRPVLYRRCPSSALEQIRRPG